jgi:hypothetical protein
MRPTYQIRAWPDDDWWLARVVTASDGADPAPLNALTQARSLAKIEPMARDLIATIVDADEATFGVTIEYDLPDDVGELVRQAKGARAWLDAAQDLWQGRSAVAARALAEKGYSLREAAVLLGLSHQRVDQLLDRPFDDEPHKILLFEAQSLGGCFGAAADPWDADAVLVLRGQARDHWNPSQHSYLETQFAERVRALLRELASGRNDPETAALD